MNIEQKIMGINKRNEIRGFIISYMKVHGYGPSYKEIGDGVGLRSKSSVGNHINRMLKDGMLETDTEPGTPRALRVPGYKFIKEKQ